MRSAKPKRETTYPKSTCATCEAPLDVRELALYLENPQLHCTRSKAPDHLPLRCLQKDCTLKFADLLALKDHSKISAHASVLCGVPGCATALCTLNVRDHYHTHHKGLEYRCAECNEGYPSQNHLSNHGSTNEHNAFTCEYSGCDAVSRTINDIRRHELKHRKNVPRYPCTRCQRYVNNSFAFGEPPRSMPCLSNTVILILIFVWAVTKEITHLNARTIFDSICEFFTLSKMFPYFPANVGNAERSPSAISPSLRNTC